MLRLRAAGTSGRDIARAVGVARSTVAEYLRQADAARVSWPLPDDLDEQGLDALLFPATPPTTERPVPDWAKVSKELKSRKHHMTLRLLWLEWKAELPQAWGYPSYTTSVDSTRRTRRTRRRAAVPPCRRAATRASRAVCPCGQSRPGWRSRREAKTL